MYQKLFVIVFCVAGSGCTMFPPVADTRDRTPGTLTNVSPTDIAAFLPGSQVVITCKSETSSQEYTGTVMHASPDGVALLNCELLGVYHKEPAYLKGPLISRMFKISGVGIEKVPVQWVSIRKITSVNVTALPPPDYVAPRLEINTDDRPFFERIDPVSGQPVDRQASRVPTFAP
jgi:hypothetical protein